jgi:hypothetical protein
MLERNRQLTFIDEDWVAQQNMAMKKNNGIKLKHIMTGKLQRWKPSYMQMSLDWR